MIIVLHFSHSVGNLALFLEGVVKKHSALVQQYLDVKAAELALGWMRMTSPTGTTGQ
jgi:hypothetical protein